MVCFCMRLYLCLLLNENVVKVGNKDEVNLEYFLRGEFFLLLYVSLLLLSSQLLHFV